MNILETIIETKKEMVNTIFDGINSIINRQKGDIDKIKLKNSLAKFKQELKKKRLLSEK